MTMPWNAAVDAKRRREQARLFKPVVEMKTLNHMTPALYCQACRDTVQEVTEITMGTTTQGPPNYFTISLCKICRYDWAAQFMTALVSGEDLNT